jgi:hypothetical protein
VTEQDLVQERGEHPVERKRLRIDSPEWWAEWDRRWEAFDRARQQYEEARDHLLKLARRR